VVDATLIAVEMHAGADNASTNPSFPEATTVAMFAARNWSMMDFIDPRSVSHGDVYRSPPRLMFTAAML
jgi:hypothetical protein